MDARPSLEAYLRGARPRTVLTAAAGLVGATWPGTSARGRVAVPPIGGTGRVPAGDREYTPGSPGRGTAESPPAASPPGGEAAPPRRAGLLLVVARPGPVLVRVAVRHRPSEG